MGVTFTSSSANDADNDGCRDSDEDLCLNYSIDNTNPDMDGICDSDARDLCPGDDSGTSFTATSVDADNDGCEDGAGNEDKCGGIDGNAVSNEDGDGDGLCGELSMPRVIQKEITVLRLVILRKKTMMEMVLVMFVTVILIMIMLMKV